MKIAFSWDDGALEDIKLFELHRKYQIPGMFFVPTRNSEGRKVLTPDLIRKNADELISFGGHTQNHVYLTKIPVEKVECEVADNKKYLEDILQREIKDFCFPGGKYDESILGIVRKHFRTVRTADTMCFEKPENSLLRPAFHFYPRGVKSLLGNGLRNRSYAEMRCVIRDCRRDYFDIIRSVIERESGKDKCVMIWGHSWEIDAIGMWDILEELFQFVRNTYSDEIVDYNGIFSLEQRKY